MDLVLNHYETQQQKWPHQGQHILAQYTDEVVVVYQAYRPEIGLYAAHNQVFGGAFSYSRMSWIKPNFLWMMYRSGWGEKQGQEVILAIHLKRDYFDFILSSAWPSSNMLGISDQAWKSGLSQSEVRLQWDPDHDPGGASIARRAIQLGLRGSMLTPFKGEGIIKIENISEFVQENKKLVDEGLLSELKTPCERVYLVSDGIRKVLCMQP